MGVFSLKKLHITSQKGLKFCMVILNKKRLLIVLSAILISMGIFSINAEKAEETIQTVALPVSNKVIVIDARPWCTR